MFLLEIKLIYTILDASCLIGISTNLRKQQSDDKGIGQLNGYIVVEFFTLWIILLSFTYWQSFTIFMLSMSRENKNWFMVIEDIVLAPSWLLIKTRRKDLVKTVKVWMYRRFPAPKTSWNLLRYVSRWERTAFNYNPKEINIRKQSLESKNQLVKFVFWTTLFFILVSSTLQKQCYNPNFRPRKHQKGQFRRNAQVMYWLNFAFNIKFWTWTRQRLYLESYYVP